MSDEKFYETYHNTLLSLELPILQAQQQNVNLYDSDVLKVLDAALAQYKAKITNYPLPENKLSDELAHLYTCINLALEENSSQISLKETHECLKYLKKSVEYWTRKHGSRGYLQFLTTTLKGILKNSTGEIHGDNSKHDIQNGNPPTQ